MPLLSTFRKASFSPLQNGSEPGRLARVARNRRRGKTTPSYKRTSLGRFQSGPERLRLQLETAVPSSDPVRTAFPAVPVGDPAGADFRAPHDGRISAQPISRSQIISTLRAWQLVRLESFTEEGPFVLADTVPLCLQRSVPFRSLSFSIHLSLNSSRQSRRPGF